MFYNVGDDFRIRSVDQFEPLTSAAFNRIRPACALMDCVACRAISLGGYVGRFAAKGVRYAMCARPCPEPNYSEGKEPNSNSLLFCTLTVTRLRPPSLNPVPTGNRELAARSGGSNGKSVGTLRKNAISGRCSMPSGCRIFWASETIGRVNCYVCEPVVF
jgi:hypothetical protein